MVLPAVAVLKPEVKVKAPGVELEAKLGSNPGDLTDDKLLLDFLVESLASPAIKLEGAKPRDACKCFELPTGKQLCHRSGYIGTLLQEQIKEGCSTIVPVPDGRAVRYRHWLDAVGICKEEIEPLKKGERLMPWLSCMGRETRARGIQI